MQTTPASPRVNQTTNSLSKRRGEPKSNWEKITIVASGALFIVIILILGYWFFTLRPQIGDNSPMQDNQTLQSAIDSESNVGNQTPEDWKEISDDKLEIKFSYPPGWSAELLEEPTFYSVGNKDEWDLKKYSELIVRSPDYISDKTSDGGEELKEGSIIVVSPYKNNLLFQSIDEVSSGELGPRDFEKKITIDGFSARRTDYTLQNAFFATEVYILKQGRAFLIRRSYLEGERSTHEEIFNTVLGSFEFND